jgi:hypothetical protein
MNSTTMFLFTVVLLCAGTASAASYTLVRDGQPAATIVLAQEPTRSAQFAAAELQYHVKLITGATLPVVAEDQPVTGLRLLVGDSAPVRALKVSPDSLKPYEYLVTCRRDAIVMLGRDKPDTGKVNMEDHTTFPGFYDEHATCAAVYDFLERGCGVRWVLPTEIGIIRDERPTLTVRGLEIKRAPFMEMRNQSTGYPIPANLHGDTIKPDKPQETLPWAEQYKWWHRQRIGGRWWQASHSLEGYYDRFLKTHPDWFAQGQTGRPSQMCYTNPELIQQVVQDARDFFDGKPAPGTYAQGDVFAVVPMDSGAPCKCPNCQAKVKAKAERGVGQFSNDSWSELVFSFVDAIAREVAKTHPGKWIGTLGYSNYAYPPQTFKLSPNVSVQLCFHARFPYAPKPMQNDWRILDEWLAESRERPKLLWMYYCFPALIATQQQFRCFPAFCPDTIMDNMRRYTQAGIRGLYFEPSYMSGSPHRNPLMDQLESWLTFKLADDPTLDGRKLKDEFFTRYYGAAAKPMRQAYELIERTFSDPSNYPERLRGHQTEECAWGYLGTEERMRELGRYMQLAEWAAQTDLEKRRVALFDEGIYQYMVKGRATYVAKAGLRQSTLQNATCPRVPSAGGDPKRVAWDKAAKLTGWRELQGGETTREVLGRLAHDGQFLYLMLEEKLDTKKLVFHEDHVWDEDEWEIFLGDGRAQPYHQMGINARGVHADLIHQPGGMEDWTSGARIVADISAPDRWVTYVALPLKTATPKGLEPGRTLYLNIVRSTDMTNALAWIPTFGGFHAADRFGEVRLAP